MIKKNKKIIKIKTTNEKLSEKSNKLFESLSNHLDDEDIEILNKLLEIERELTLRENYEKKYLIKINLEKEVEDEVLAEWIIEIEDRLVGVNNSLWNEIFDHVMIKEIKTKK
jgi:predicted house-cleaning noncanonical NTP pyrophosphatase (MazG superfamily)